MDDLISRKALISRFERYQSDCEEENDIIAAQVFADCICELQDAPAVDAAPVVWADVIGFDGLYQISNFGECRNNKGVVLKQGIKRTSGTCYKTVNLWKDGKYHKKYIHRMMAEVFIDNPNNYEFVNHKDEDGTNNHLSNLEWCTREYNVNYGTAKERRAKKIRGVPHTVPFPVSWTVKMKKKQKETQDVLSYHTQAAGCSDKARAKASGGRQPIEECGRTGL